jgi:predicted KAP-like P-loop ATPase
MLNSDIPIQKTIDDKLSRGSFAKDLAYAIISRDTPDGFVIGMYGEWGSGKTSVINMVVEQLESQGTAENEKPVIMRFNPWLCADQKQLVSQFFKQLSSAIKGECIEHSEYSRLKNICGYMNDYAEIFDLAGELPNVGSLIKFVGKWRVKQANEKNNNIQEIKDSIAKNLRECELKLIVTIDDIDRLSNEEIISVFQLVKSLADFPYTTYLLAFDREIVTKALGKVQECDGAKYLEKIVQAPFELPAADFEDISNVFFSKMNSIIGDIPEDKWDKYYWSDMFHYGIKNYLVTIRHAIRLTNTFSLKYAMVKDEVNLIDLIGLTCLQVFEPDVYSRLHFHKEMLCGSEIEYARQDEHSRKKMEASWSGIISGTPDHRVEWVKSILC